MLFSFEILLLIILLASWPGSLIINSLRTSTFQILIALLPLNFKFNGIFFFGCFVLKLWLLFALKFKISTHLLPWNFNIRVFFFVVTNFNFIVALEFQIFQVFIFALLKSLFSAKKFSYFFCAMKFKILTVLLPGNLNFFSRNLKFYLLFFPRKLLANNWSICHWRIVFIHEI